MSRNDTIHLSEVIAKVHHFKVEEQQAFDILAIRRAAKLALQDGEKFDDRQRELLQGAADGELSRSDLDARGLKGAKKQNRAYRAVVEQIGEAEGQLREEEMDRLGMAGFQPTPWQRVEQFIITRSQIPVDPDALEGYAADAALKSFSETTPISTEIARLNDQGATDELLRLLWKHEEAMATELHLPSPSDAEGRPLMTDGEKAGWDALRGTALTAKEVARKLDTSEQTIKEHAQELRRKGYNVKNQSGRGYFRPDAPPADG